MLRLVHAVPLLAEELLMVRSMVAKVRHGCGWSHRSRDLHLALVLAVSRAAVLLLASRLVESHHGEALLILAALSVFLACVLAKLVQQLDGCWNVRESLPEHRALATALRSLAPVERVLDDLVAHIARALVRRLQLVLVFAALGGQLRQHRLVVRKVVDVG